MPFVRAFGAATLGEQVKMVRLTSLFFFVLILRSTFASTPTKSASKASLGWLFNIQSVCDLIFIKPAKSWELIISTHLVTKPFELWHSRYSYDRGTFCRFLQMGHSKTSVDSGFQKNAAVVETVRTTNNVFMPQCYSLYISHFSHDVP